MQHEGPTPFRFSGYPYRSAFLSDTRSHERALILLRPRNGVKE
ncbi:hypothetical protein B005_4223 [Nocardiopsis alba ATCC BAA-2165]|uniref:Uncharacterized protein n=1 Tax=Nocardiopsis alba (strain ATCC BAA-2165 / BE74) TaxID=1205910 RepID=J7L1D6_NOCAA|nr:hypothetical protein B005_4223 [Nocardiopsis alba ATCC BAA-2165]